MVHGQHLVDPVVKPASETLLPAIVAPPIRTNQQQRYPRAGPFRSCAYLADVAADRLAGRLRSHVDDLQPSLRAGGQCLDVATVAREDNVPSFEGTDDDTCVDDIGAPSGSQQSARLSSARTGQFLDEATGQQPRQVRLRPAPPNLSEHSRRHRWCDTSFEGPSVQQPHPAVVTTGGDQGAAVVGRAAHRRSAGVAWSSVPTPA